jgi:hypothetical protein
MYYIYYLERLISIDSPNSSLKEIYSFFKILKYLYMNSEFKKGEKSFNNTSTSRG